MQVSAQTAGWQVLTMSWPMDQYESLRQKACPEPWKPQLLGHTVASLGAGTDSNSDSNADFRCFLQGLPMFPKDWEQIAAKVGIIAGNCNKVQAKAGVKHFMPIINKDPSRLQQASRYIQLY